MEKILFKKIVSSFVIIGILFFTLFSCSVYSMSAYSMMNRMNEMLEQIEQSYEKALITTEEKTELYIENYLKRTYVIDFFLASNPSMRNKEGLEKIKELMEVESIHLIDYSGEIVLSTDSTSIGLNLFEHKEAEPFWELIRSREKYAEVIQLDATNITNGIPKDFIGVKSMMEEYSVVQIGINKRVLEEIQSSSSLESVLKSIPTVHTESLGAVDSSTGKIIGMTINNPHTLSINRDIEKSDLIKVLESSREGKLLKINGVYQFLKTKTVDNNIILYATVEANTFFKEYIYQILLISIIIVLFIILLMIELKRHLRKYILKDFLNIKDKVQQLMLGNYEITFETEYDTELKALATILNDWKDSYKYKSKRMTRLSGLLSSHAAIFECLYSINSNFYSDNIVSILGVNETEWNEIKNTPGQFERYIEDLMIKSNDDGLIYINGKIISIKSFKVNNEFYGIILDKTKETSSAYEMKCELQRAQETADRDFLTNLFNRKAFEKYVKGKFITQPNEGIMLIFDLDNFKSINDLLGHPEGDKLLKIFAECLKGNFREDDMVARLGGDEFVVFIDSNLPLEILENKLNSILEYLRNKLSHYYNEYNISASIGIAYVDNKINTYEELYKCADVALYIAKRMGKDRYFINEDNIRCMRGECVKCTGDCKKRKILGL